MKQLRGEELTGISIGNEPLEESRGHNISFPRRVLPRFCWIPCPSLIGEGAGRSGADWHPRPLGKKMLTGRVARQPDQPDLPARWFDQSARALPDDRRVQRRHLADCWGASKAQLNRCVPTRPDAYGHQPPRQCSPPRPLLVRTDTCSRVCSPSRLPRRRFTAPRQRCPRPSHPARDIRRFARRPSHRTGCIFITAIPNFDKANYF